MSRRPLTKLLAILLIITLCAGLMPTAAFAIDDKWKIMQLTTSDQRDVSISNYAKQTAYVKRAFQPIITNADDTAEYFPAMLSFSIQYDQPLRIEVYELKDEYKLNDITGKSKVSLASGGIDDFVNNNPLGELIGCLYGTYIDRATGEEVTRVFDGGLDSAQLFKGYEGPKQTTRTETSEIKDYFNTIEWNGLYVPADLTDNPYPSLADITQVPTKEPAAEPDEVITSGSSNIENETYGNEAIKTTTPEDDRMTDNGEAATDNQINPNIDNSTVDPESLPETNQDALQQESTAPDSNKAEVANSEEETIPPDDDKWLPNLLRL